MANDTLGLLRNAYDSARQQAAGDGNARAENYWLGAMRGVDDAQNMKPPRHKTFWVIFLKDPATGVITGMANSHNAKADYKDNPYYLGTHKIEVDMEKLK